ISGTYVLTDTIRHAFDSVFASSYRNSSAIISGREIVRGANELPGVPAGLLARVRALPDVTDAGGYVAGDVTLVGRNGKTISSGGAPSFGFGVDAGESRFSPVTLASGSWAAGPDEIVIDRGTARKHHYAVGDAIRAQGNGPTRTYTIVGLGRIGGVSIGGATL